MSDPSHPAAAGNGFAGVVQRMSYIRPAISGVAVVLGVLPVLVLYPSDALGPAWSWLVVVASAAGVVWAQTVLRPVLAPLPAGTRLDPAAGAGRLQQAALMLLAFAEVPALVGFVLSVAVEGWLPAAIGGVISVVAINVLGPTEARLSAWRDRLESAGGSTGL